MAEVVRTYVRIESLSDLRPDKPGDVTFDNVIFSDVLKFNTTLNAGVTPTLELSSPVGKFKLTDAKLTASAKRSDLHDVIVALARDPKIDVDEPARRSNTRSMQRMTAARTQRQDIIEKDLRLDSRSVTALVQKDASARNRVLIELVRLRNLEDDEREAPRILGERLLELLRLP